MERLTEVELTSVTAVDSVPLLQLRTSTFCRTNEEVHTPHGTVQVGIQGERTKPAIVTYHDIGMNADTCFQGFFTFSEMAPILDHFCVYHITAPGQQFQAPSLDVQHTGGDTAVLGTAEYPTLDQLAEMIFIVAQKLEIKTFIGFGLGAGANILARFALMNPNRVDALVLINCTSTKAGWTEWGYQKLNAWYLRGGNLSKYSEDYLLWHWFGAATLARNKDLTEHYRQSLKGFNAHNLAMFIQSYYSRTDLNIVRELDKSKKKEVRCLKCCTLLAAGAWSPHVDDTVQMNGRLDPEITTWMKVADCGGNPLEEQPAKLTEAFLLFLQGVGHVPFLNPARLRQAAALSSQRQQKPGADTPSTNTQRPANVPGSHSKAEELVASC